MGFPGSAGRKWRQWGARVPWSGPLHRCVHAGSRVLGQCEWCLDWRRPRALVLGSCCSLPRGATLRGSVGVRNHPACEVHQLDRCARARYWLQQSARGVGPREATSVAAGVGDGGLVPGFGKPPWSERAPRSRSSGDGCSMEGPVEGCLLVKGVSGRGNPQPSRVVGGTGLDLVACGVSARCAAG
jgi:hypothetical protein